MKRNETKNKNVYGNEDHVIIYKLDFEQTVHHRDKKRTG